MLFRIFFFNKISIKWRPFSIKLTSIELNIKLKLELVSGSHITAVQFHSQVTLQKEAMGSQI